MTSILNVKRTTMTIPTRLRMMSSIQLCKLPMIAFLMRRTSFLKRLLRPQTTTKRIQVLVLLVLLILLFLETDSVILISLSSRNKAMIVTVIVTVLVLLIMTTTPTTMKMPTDYWNLSQNEIITTSITTEDPKN